MECSPTSIQSRWATWPKMHTPSVVDKYVSRNGGRPCGKYLVRTAGVSACISERLERLNLEIEPRVKLEGTGATGTEDRADPRGRPAKVVGGGGWIAAHSTNRSGSHIC